MNEKLKEETRQRENEQEAKVTLEKELMALYKQVETARADVVKSSRVHSLLLTPMPFTMVASLRIA